MKSEKRQLSVMLPEDVYLQLKVKAMLRKISVTDLIIEMVRYWKPPKMTEEDKKNNQLLKKYFDEVMKPQLEEIAGKGLAKKEGIFNKIKAMSDQGMSHSQIAAELENQKVPTLSGRGQWHRQTVQQVLKKGA